MAKAIVLILSFFVCVNVSYSQDVTVTEVDPSSIIQGESFKVYAMGIGSDRSDDSAMLKAEMFARQQLSEMINGIEFDYYEDEDNVAMYSETSGTVIATREAVYPLSENPFYYLIMMSSEVNRSELNAEDFLAFEAIVLLDDSEEISVAAESMRSAIGKTRAEAVKQFADSKGIELTKGKGYVGDIDMYYNDDDLLELSYVMLLDVE